MTCRVGFAIADNSTLWQGTWQDIRGILGLSDVPQQLARLLPDHEFSEAAGILQMIGRTPEQQALYDARLKFQRDEAAKLEGARLEGREEGRVEGRQEGRVEGEKKGLSKGKLLGRVLLLRELLNVNTPTHTELADLSESELSAMADDLQSRLRHR